MPVAPLSAGSGSAPPESASAPTWGGLMEEVTRAFAAARETVSSTLDLVALEAHRAGAALIWMFIWSAVAVICVVAAWLGLMAALGMWIVSLGAPAIPTVAGVALANLALAGLLVYLSIRMGRNLLFSATRRQIAGKPTGRAAP
jgi:hypothetical protein